MARITVEEVYRGEKYGVMSAAMAEYDERTWVEMLIVRHSPTDSSWQHILWSR